jgi:Raf kinase inhibitor-like YbhB/YbcL family protein
MWKSRLIVAVVAMLASCSSPKEVKMADFMLKSDAFAEGAVLPTQFTCDGEDQSPPLNWSEPPSGTKSFALVVDDPDAPSGTFRHWAAFNIPAGTRALPAGAGNETAGDIAQAQNDFGRPGYGGACPPPGHGTHHYRFKLFALDTDRLDLPAGASIAQVEAAATERQLARAVLTGTYERQ